VQVLHCNVFSGSVPDLPAARAAMAVQWLAELSKTPKCAVALHARIFALPTSVLPTCFFRAAGEAKGPSCVQPAPSACSSAIRSTPPSPSPPHSPLPPLLFFCFNCSDCDKPVDSLNICVTADSAVCSHMLGKKCGLVGRRGALASETQGKSLLQRRPHCRDRSHVFTSNRRWTETQSLKTSHDASINNTHSFIL